VDRPYLAERHSDEVGSCRRTCGKHAG
jgi:hypothetical protein